MTQVHPYTIGGFPASDAWTFTTEHQQELGRIVRLLVSGTPADRRQGYLDYHAFKRRFMLTVWTEFMERLDTFRESVGHRGIVTIEREIAQEIVVHKVALPATPESSVLLDVSTSRNDHPIPKNPQVKKESKELDTPIQMSLF